MRVWFPFLFNVLLLSVYSYSVLFSFCSNVFTIFSLCVSELTPVSAVPSPTGFSGPESCVQILWLATKPAMKAFSRKELSWKTIDHILIWLIIFVIKRKMVLLSNSSVWTKILFNLIIVHFTTPLVFVCMHHFIGAFVWSSVRIFLLGLHRTHYLWQILREVVTEDGKGLATNSQVIAKTTLV